MLSQALNNGSLPKLGRSDVLYLNVSAATVARILEGRVLFCADNPWCHDILLKVCHVALPHYYTPANGGSVVRGGEFESHYFKSVWMIGTAVEFHNVRTDTNCLCSSLQSVSPILRPPTPVCDSPNRNHGLLFGIDDGVGEAPKQESSGVALAHRPAIRRFPNRFHGALQLIDKIRRRF